MAHDNVELVAVHDQIALAVGAGVDGLALDLDTAERQTEKLAREFVVVPGMNTMRAPLLTLRRSFCMTSLCACGQCQPERSRQPSIMSPTK